MGSVWKRLNHINKRASKFKFTASYQEICLEAGPSWQPTALSLVWTRRGRRVVADPVAWEPTMKSPYIGMCVWPVPENKEIMVTLFRDQRQEEYDNKDWFFVLEDVKDGKRKAVAQGRLNLKDYATQIPTQHNLTIKLRPLTKKVSSSYLVLTLTSEFLKEGKATDDDMRSVASLVSNSTIPNDIADLDTLKEDDEAEPDESIHVPLSEFTALTQSIQTMNSKLDNLTPSLVPVRTLLTTEPRRRQSDDQRSAAAAAVSKLSSRLESDDCASPPVAPVLPSNNNFLTRKQEAEDGESVARHQFPPPVRLLTERAVDPAPPQAAAAVSQVFPPKTAAVPVTEAVQRAAAPPLEEAKGVTRPPAVPSRTLLPESVSRRAVVGEKPDAVTSGRSSTSTSGGKHGQVEHETGGKSENHWYRAAEGPDASGQLTHLASQEKVDQAGLAAVTNDLNGILNDLQVVTASLSQASSGGLSQPTPTTTTTTANTKPTRVITKTQSQELRDFMGEFVLTSTINFDPMSFQDHQEPIPPAKVGKTAVGGEKSKGSDTLKRIKAEGGGGGEMVRPSSRAGETATRSEEANNKKPEVGREADVGPAEVPTADSAATVKRQEILPSDSFINSMETTISGREGVSGGNSSNSETSSATTTPSLENGGGGVAGGAAQQQQQQPVPSKAGGSSSSSISSGSSSSSHPLQQTGTGIGGGSVGASSDLLDWSKSILAKYSNLKVTNFTSSWRNGLAFCALIHSYYPQLIPYDTLNPHDIKVNCKLAFESGEILGIPRVMEPENMVIRRIPDKLAVMTYLHQLRSSLGTPETNQLYEISQQSTDSSGSGSCSRIGVRKSFSEGNIKFFNRTNSFDIGGGSELATVLEEGGGGGGSHNVSASSSNNGDISPKTVSKYRQKAKDLMAKARMDSREKSGSPSPEKEKPVIMRQKSLTPKPRRDNRLSYIDNEIKFLDAEQLEIDRQAAILDKRLRETSEEDDMVYDALLQQWFTLVNKKNALLRRQMQLNILEKEDDLEKKYMMLQEELRTYSDMEEETKTEEDRQREELLLQELVLVVNQRNELVHQRDEEERMIENDEQIDHDVTIPDEQLVRGKNRDECRMQ